MCRWVREYCSAKWGLHMIGRIVALAVLLVVPSAYADTATDALAKYKAEHQKAQQQAQKLQQDMVNTQAVILRLEGAIAALTALETEPAEVDEPETEETE